MLCKNGWLMYDSFNLKCFIKSNIEWSDGWSSQVMSQSECSCVDLLPLSQCNNVVFFFTFSCRISRESGDIIAFALGLQCVTWNTLIIFLFRKIIKAALFPSFMTEGNKWQVWLFTFSNFSGIFFFFLYIFSWIVKALISFVLSYSWHLHCIILITECNV